MEKTHQVINKLMEKKHPVISNSTNPDCTCVLAQHPIWCTK